MIFAKLLHLFAVTEDGMKMLDLSPPEALKLWHHYQDSNVKESFRGYRHFIRAFSGKLPLLSIRKQAETAALNENQNPMKVYRYFQYNPIYTPHGLIAYARAALELQKKMPEIRNKISKYWYNFALSNRDIMQIVSLNKNLLTPHMLASKIHACLDNGDINQAKELLPYAGPKTKLQANQRILLQTSAPLKLINTLKKTFKPGDPIYFDLVRYYRKTKQDKLALEMLSKLSTTQEKKAAPTWWNQRHILAIRAMERGNWGYAYNIMAKNQLTANEILPYSIAEFRLGWIELEKLKKYKAAFMRFDSQLTFVKMPISKSRMAYYAGMALLKLKEKQKARSFFLLANEYPGTFYGMLATSELKKMDQLIPNKILRDKQPDKKTVLQFDQRFLVKALKGYGENLTADLLEVLFTFLCGQLHTIGEEVLATDLAYNIGGPFLGVIAGKRAQFLDTVITKQSYPLLDKFIQQRVLGNFSEDITFLVHAIIRQESNFHSVAVSQANARGLMQLIDSTAKAMYKLAPKFGIQLPKGRDVYDTHTNVALGTTHLIEVLKAYDGYIVLALCAYNAGGHNVKEWLQDFGDPRETKDWLNWIESIPFGETRNYVQRVIENMVIYRALLKNDADRLNIIDYISQPIRINLSR